MDTFGNTVGTTIRDHFDEILCMWIAEVEAAPSTRGLTRAETLNFMPVYLRSLADPSYGPLGSASELRTHVVETHLTARMRQGFDVAEVVDEFAGVGRCLSRVWAEAPPASRPQPADVERFHAELHLATANAVRVFQKHMQVDAQSEKRFARRLDAAARRSLRSADAQGTADFAEVLRIIADATGADSATVVLQEGAAGALQVAAALGAPLIAAAVHAFAWGLDLYGGDEPHAIDDAIVSRDVPVDAQLLTVGIRRLLLTRLPAGEGRRAGVVIATTEPRLHTIREVRRLEALAVGLSHHVETASLQAALRRTIAALRDEKIVREAFVAILAHDLRGPLAVAKAQAAALRETVAASPELRMAMGRMDRTLGRADGMVCDLLDANRIQAGEQVRLTIAECDLREIACETVEELSAVYPRRFLLDASEEVRGFFGCDELRRALWNLAVNAVKYGSRTQAIVVGVQREIGFAVLSVHNEGCPVSREEQSRLFEPFVRGAIATETKQLGWGLGLALVRGAAHAHGGEVSVVSDATHGTTFTMTLPLDARPYQRSSVPPPPPEAPPPEAPPPARAVLPPYVN